ncbi:MAG TPA: hypothetical protein ENI42_06845 [Thermoplasmatales archaeon]|nr:hypothetical protein [Thermoplasmatales archaeon]
MGEWWTYLLSMLMLVFGLGSIVAGAFTAYFGSGRSRAVGGILVLIGLIVLVLFFGYTGTLSIGLPVLFRGVVINSVLAVVGAIIGALIALGIFLVAIMKA